MEHSINEAKSLELDLKNDLENLTGQISSLEITLLGYYNKYLNRGYYLPEEKEEFQHDVLAGTVEIISQQFWNMESKVRTMQASLFISRPGKICCKIN